MVKATVRHWKIRALLEVPMIFNDEIVGLILLDDPDRQHEFADDEVELRPRLRRPRRRRRHPRPGPGSSCSSKFEAAGRQLSALRRATAVDEQLSDLVLEGRSLAGPDPQPRPAPAASPARSSARPATGSRWPCPRGRARALCRACSSPRSRACRRCARRWPKTTTNRAFVIGPIPSAGVLHRHVVAPVMLGEEVWGRLVVMEHKTRFTGGDVVAVRRAATLIALQVSSERKAVEADWNAGSSLAAELLGGSSDTAIARRRADRLGVSLDARRVVMLIGSRSGQRGRRAGLPRRRRGLRPRGAAAERPRHRGRRLGRGAGRGARRRRVGGVRLRQPRDVRSGAAGAASVRAAGRRHLRRPARPRRLPRRPPRGEAGGRVHPPLLAGRRAAAVHAPRSSGSAACCSPAPTARRSPSSPRRRSGSWSASTRKPTC